MSQSNEKIGAAKDAAAKAQEIVEDIAGQVRSVADGGVQKLGGLAHQHRDTIDAQLDKVVHLAESKVGPQYADRVEQVKELVEKGIDKLAGQRPAARAASDLKDGDVAGAAEHAADAVNDTAKHVAGATSDAAHHVADAAGNAANAAATTARRAADKADDAAESN